MANKQAKKAAKQYWTCGKCFADDLWIGHKVCGYCGTAKPPAISTKGKGKGKGKAAGKAKGKGVDKTPESPEVQRNPFGQPANPQSPFKVEAAATPVENAKPQEQATHPTVSDGPLTTNYHGAPITLHQLHKALKGISYLDDSHPIKQEILEAIRSLQKEKALHVEPDARIAQLEAVLTRINKEEEDATQKAQQAADEKAALYNKYMADAAILDKRIADAKAKLVGISRRKAEAEEDMQEANDRKAKSPNKPQPPPHAKCNPLFTDEFKQFVQNHYGQLHRAAVLCDWACDDMLFVEQFKEFSELSNHEAAMVTVTAEQPKQWSKERRDWVHRAQAWYAVREYLVPSQTTKDAIAALVQLLEDERGDQQAGVKRDGPENLGQPAKRQPPVIQASMEENCPDAPYYVEPFEVIAVKEELIKEQRDQVHESVLKFNTMHPMHGAPPISDSYEGDKGKWAAEYHLAIHADHKKWNRLPTYIQYVEARKKHAHRPSS